MAKKSSVEKNEHRRKLAAQLGGEVGIGGREPTAQEFLRKELGLSLRQGPRQHRRHGWEVLRGDTGGVCRTQPADDPGDQGSGGGERHTDRVPSSVLRDEHRIDVLVTDGLAETRRDDGQDAEPDRHDDEEEDEAGHDSTQRMAAFVA